jgi:hypothetical protein
MCIVGAIGLKYNDPRIDEFYELNESFCTLYDSFNS